ncbi:MAG TPA: hypothetical protein DCP49_00360 [Erysipelotrichaceae bacterium]|nr:hypothetical protein [Erysipelotrichaceae bacterium]
MKFVSKSETAFKKKILLFQDQEIKKNISARMDHILIDHAAENMFCPPFIDVLNEHFPHFGFKYNFENFICFS